MVEHTRTLALGFLRGLKDLSEHPMRNADQAQQVLGHLILARVVVLSLFLGASSWQLLSGPREHGLLNAMFVVIGLTYVVSLVSAVWLRRCKNFTRFSYAQLAIDLSLATLAIHVTGGALSPYIFLYLLVILAGAILLGFEGALLVAAFGGLGYAALASQLIPPIDPTLPQASALHILGVYVALVVLAGVIGYFTREIDNAWQAAASHEEHARKLSARQKRLFDDLPEGIITVDTNWRIVGLNNAAYNTLELDKDDDFSGIAIQSLLSDYGLKNVRALAEANIGHGTPEELSLTARDGETALDLNFSARPMLDAMDNRTGVILFFTDVSHVKNIEKRLSMHERMTKLLAESMEQTETRGSTEHTQIIGESPVMTQVMNLVERISESDASVLITGESGTGKELIARAIHNGSPRSKRSFVALNCGAIPENLIESELFGHKKGSFTGAVSDNPGLFREASGGTIFLDEIGELPAQMQTKLLRVLQERCIRAVGDTKDVPVDVRVIAATNRNLKNRISSGEFREDLFYRLNVVNVVVPPLRDRKDDIPLLVGHFVRKFSSPDLPLPKISPEALEALMNYRFPGNIRELENLCERALVLGGQAILPEHLPEEVRQGQQRAPKEMLVSADSLNDTLALPNDLENILEQIEMNYLKAALDKSNGVKKHAAELLGLNFRSFRYRLKKYGMSGEEKGE